jgi:hypothetical protein
MIKYYKCTFLSEVILQASSNTQGNVVLADFIAGSNFLGMVASDYDHFKTDAFKVFHSGDVRFGDGHMAVDDKESYKTPLCYFNLKTESNTFYNRLHLSDEEEQRLRDEQKQLKQIRSGFMNSDCKYLKPSYNYAQKSKHSREYRRSEDEGMFGYSALKKGTEWIFKVDYKDEQFISDVEERLIGKRRLGKSKSAQYGQVEIKSMMKPSPLETFIPDNNLTYVYFNSRVALVDKEGNPQVTPSIENLGLKSGTIDWGKTQLQHSSYNPYNYTRKTKEYTRVVLNKGSVIVIKGLNDKESLLKGIGVYLNEGFGEVLVNPKFLEPKEPIVKEFEKGTIYTKAKKPLDENLLEFLRHKEEQEEDNFAVATEVQNKYKKLLGASKSQWGEIRSIAAMVSSKKELIQEIEKYIETGVAKQQWEDIELIKAINSSSQAIAFTKLLAKICREYTKGEENE